MINLKRLKHKKYWGYLNSGESRTSNFLFWFKDLFIWPFTDKFDQYKERFSRSWDYAKYGWLNYDFDVGYAYKLFVWKLKRLLKCLENGHAVQDLEDLKALKRFIKIFNRIGSGNYDSKYYRLHSLKWGEVELSKTSTYNYNNKGDSPTYTTWRKGTINASPEVKEQERQEFLACFTKGEEDRIRDIEEMALLMIRYSSSWWD